MNRTPQKKTTVLSSSGNILNAHRLNKLTHRAHALFQKCQKYGMTPHIDPGCCTALRGFFDNLNKIVM